jgi:hypothetical protein
LTLTLTFFFLLRSRTCILVYTMDSIVESTSLGQNNVPVDSGAAVDKGRWMVQYPKQENSLH